VPPTSSVNGTILQEDVARPEYEKSGGPRARPQRFANSGGLCHNAALLPPGRRAAVAAANCSVSTLNSSKPAVGAEGLACRLRESQMPKVKTKSGAKKRFKVTGTGKVLYQQSRKRHGMIKRTNKQIRQLRGTAVLFKTDGDNVKKYFLPNG
jgi:large subunit ribosomal protein L35